MSTTSAAITTKQVAALVGVTPRSNWRPMLTVESVKDRGFAEARYGSGTAYQRIGEAAQMLAHLGTTGRLPYEATLALRETTPYRACRIIAAMVNADMTGLIEIERARIVGAIIMKEV